MLVSTAFDQAIALDGVYSEGQLKRHFGLELADVVGEYPLLTLPHRATRGATRVSELCLVVHPTKQSFADFRLKHLAGTAEMRLALGASPKDWRVFGGTNQEIPDALWSTPKGLVAVEFDGGFYALSTIKQKALAFSKYAKQVWGGVNPLHLSRLQAAVGNAQVVLADWSAS